MFCQQKHEDRLFFIHLHYTNTLVVFKFKKIIITREIAYLIQDFSELRLLTGSPAPSHVSDTDSKLLNPRKPYEEPVKRYSVCFNPQKTFSHDIEGC